MFGAKSSMSRNAKSTLRGLITTSMMWVTMCTTSVASAGSIVRPPQASDVLSDDPRPIVLRNAVVVDGTGAPAVPRGWITIEKGRIVATGRGAPPIVRGARVLDLKGRSVYPGLSEMHAHPGRPAQAQWMFKLFLANGITNVKVPGNWSDAETGVHHDTAIRKYLETEPVAPHIYMSGTTIAGKSRYAPPDFKAEYLSAGPELQKLLELNLALNPDFLKTYDSIKPSALRQAAAFAKQHDLYLSGHIPDEMTSVEAIDAGLTIIEHLIIRAEEVNPKAAGDQSYDNFWADVDMASPTVKATLDAWAARRETFFIDPTLTVFFYGGVRKGLYDAPPPTPTDKVISPAMLMQRAAGQDPAAPTPKTPATPEQRETAQRSMHQRAVFVAEAYHRGVRILTGTDMPLQRMPTGESLLQELQLLTSGGLTPVEVIHASTGIAADAFRRKDRGIIAPGQAADLVIARGDVSKDIRVTRNVEHVLLGGRILDPADLLQQARDLAAADQNALLPGEP